MYIVEHFDIEYGKEEVSCERAWIGSIGNSHELDQPEQELIMWVYVYIPMYACIPVCMCVYVHIVKAYYRQGSTVYRGPMEDKRINGWGFEKRPMCLLS